MVSALSIEYQQRSTDVSLPLKRRRSLENGTDVRSAVRRSTFAQTAMSRSNMIEVRPASHGQNPSELNLKLMDRSLLYCFWSGGQIDHVFVVFKSVVDMAVFR